MRWILICFLLASAHDISTAVSTARPKRELWPIKNLISSKLFGTETVVIELPKIPDNEAYKLFKIKGHDNVYLRVTRKPEKQMEIPIKIKYEGPVMVSPELAIIGNYLGTTTQQETILALDIAKNLVNSGILRNELEKIVQEVVVPMSPHISHNGYFFQKPVNPVEVITEERNPTYFNPIIESSETIVKRRPISIYPPPFPPMAVASEIKYKPLQTKYSYKQEFEDADMTYESYNNRGVVVKRTHKVPVKPRYIAIRLADVVSIAAKPHLIRSQPPVTSTVMYEEPLNVMPIHSYVMEKTPRVTPSPEEAEEPGYVDSINYNGHPNYFDRSFPKASEFLDVPNFIEQSKVPFDIRDHVTDGEIDKLNKFINTKLDHSKNKVNVLTPRPHDSNEEMDNDQKEDTDSQTSSGKIVSRYSYKQMGDEGQDNYTVVRIEEPKLNQSEINHVPSGEDVPLNYVYVPPAAPRPNTNSINDHNSQNRYDDYENFNADTETYARTSIPLTLRGDLRQLEVTDKPRPNELKTNDQPSLLKNPIIVVPEIDKQNKVKTYEGGNKTTTRRPYTGRLKDKNN